MKSVEFLFDDLKALIRLRKEVGFTLKTNEGLGNKKSKFILQKMVKIFWKVIRQLADGK